MTTPPYEVTWTPSAQRDIQRLPEKIVTAIAEFAYGALVDDPHRVGRALRLDLEGQHSARRGDYRIVYRIDEAAHSIPVLAVDHRSDVYRPR